MRALEQCATEAAQAVASGFDVSCGKKTCNSSTVTIYAYRNPILLHFGLFDASCLLPDPLIPVRARHAVAVSTLPEN